MDAQVSWDENLTPSCYNGVTTVIMGNCGVGFAPVRPADRDWLLDLLDAVEDIPSSAMSAGITWEWESFPEYLDAIDAKPRVMDIATQVPHSPLRCYVMGERGAEDVQPTDEELAHMTRLVREGIEAGALGFSSNRLMAHRTKEGVPTPGTFAEYPELEAIAKGMRDGRGGVFQLVGEFERDWIGRLAEGGGLTFTFGSVEWMPDTLEFAESAESKGVRLFPQIRGRGTCVLINIDGTAHPYLINNAYNELVAELPLAERLEKMRNPDVKAAILASDWDLSNDVRRLLGENDDLEESLFLVDGTPGSLLPSLLENMLGNPETVWVLGDPPNYEPTREDSVAAYAERNRIPTDEAFYDLLTEGDGSTILLQYLEGYSQGNLDYQHKMMSHPLTRNGLSDAGAHVGALSDVEMASWNLRYWGWQRERGARVPIETIVHKQSGANADLYGLGDRGVLAVGKKADINVIDPERLGSEAPHIVHDLPENARRFVQRQTGYEYTICAGEITLEDDELTAALPGRLVRGSRERSIPLPPPS